MTTMLANYSDWTFRSKNLLKARATGIVLTSRHHSWLTVNGERRFAKTTGQFLLSKILHSI